MAIRIVTDSTSDIPIEERQKLGIDIVPLSVIFDDQKYTDGYELKKPQFYEMLGECTTLPSTSQVNPDGFFDLFKSYVDAGDQVIGVFLSSKISGTCQSALIAKDMIGSSDIHIVDSRSATFGLAILVFEAIRMRDAGVSAADIADRLNKLRNRVQFLGAVDTLKYLKMGGRLSSSATIIGGMLHIKPLVSMIDGKVESIGKVRGLKAAYNEIVQLMKAAKPDTRFPFIFGHTNAPSMAKTFIDIVGQSFDVSGCRLLEIGCVIGTHAGPGCVGIGFIKE